MNKSRGKLKSALAKLEREYKYCNTVSILFFKLEFPNRFSGFFVLSLFFVSAFFFGFLDFRLGFQVEFFRDHPNTP